MPQWIVLVDNGVMAQNAAKWDLIRIEVFVDQVLGSKYFVTIEEALMAALKTSPAKVHKDVIILPTTIITTTMTITIIMTTTITTTTMITTTIRAMNGILIFKDHADQAMKIVIATLDVIVDVINT